MPTAQVFVRTAGAGAVPLAAAEAPGTEAPAAGTSAVGMPAAGVPAGGAQAAGAAAAAPDEHVVFVHGLGGSSTNWTDLMDLLSRASREAHGPAGYSCTAVDLPGFGFSPPPPDRRYTVSAQARTVVSLINRLDSGPVHLIGNSMGGAVVTRVAAARPELVRSLTLISPALPDLRPRLLPLRLAIVATPGIGRAILQRMRDQPAAGRTDMTIRDVFHDPNLIHPLRRDEEIAEVLRRDGLAYAGAALMLAARSMVGEYLRVGSRSLWRDAARVTAPALVLHGSGDRLVNPVMAAKAARTFRSVRVVVLSGVGHVAMMEQPAIVADEIRSFLGWAGKAGNAPERGIASASRQPRFASGVD